MYIGETLQQFQYRKIVASMHKLLDNYSFGHRTVPTVYPEDIDCIVDPINSKGGIYVGNLQAAQNIQTLNKFGIKRVSHNHPKHQIVDIKYIPGEDRETFDLSKYFDQSADWIEQKLKDHNILIHCLAGVSRSVTLLLAYFIKTKGMEYHQAYDLVKRRRKIINPNSGFIKQLKDYQRVNRLNHDRARTPSPKRRSYSPIAHSPGTANTNDFKTPPSFRYPTTEYSARNRGNSTGIAANPHPKDKHHYYTDQKQRSYLGFREYSNVKPALTPEDLDKRIQQIRQKYSKPQFNRSQRLDIRPTSPYRDTISRNILLDRDIRLSKYFGQYNPYYGARRDWRNPQVYNPKGINRFLLGDY